MAGVYGNYEVMLLDEHREPGAVIACSALISPPVYLPAGASVSYSAMTGSHSRFKNREAHSQFEPMLRSPASPERTTMPAEIRPYWHVVLTIFKLVTFIRKSSSGCPIEVLLFFSLLAVTAPVTVTLWFMCFTRSTVELLSP
jgi:hypothetical protein